MRVTIPHLTAALLFFQVSVVFPQSSVVNRGCATPVPPSNYEAWVSSLTVPGPGKFGTHHLQSVFNIPVIVHVIHNNEPVNSTGATSGNNLNAAQIIDQINILNKDFNGLNPDTSLIPAVFKPLLGKFQFNFCLAVVNPTGGVLAQPGIDRINRNTKGWNTPPYSQSYYNSTIKPQSIWDPTRYFNIWVSPLSGSILGFATFPNPGSSGLGGFSPPYGNMNNDGVVIASSHFGSIGTALSGAPYHKGRTATHEVGHWLGLRHIWGDNTCANDFVTDTPPAQQSNFGCPNHPLRQGVCTGNTTGEMFMNFMDYTNDVCMQMFTIGQKQRAQIIMVNSPLRLSLLTSTVCNLPSAINDIGIMYVSYPTYSQAVHCVNAFTPQIVVRNFGSNPITSVTYTYNIDGMNTQTIVLTSVIPPSANATVTLPPLPVGNGNHNFNVGALLPNGTADSFTTNNKSHQPFTVTGAFSIAVTGNTAICSGQSASLTASGGATNYTWFPGGGQGASFVTAPLANSIYTVAGSVGSCIRVRFVSVSVSPQPTVNASDVLFCSASGGTVLTASGACSYLWMPGATAGASLGVSPASTTQFTVLGSCGGCSDSKVVTVSVTPSPSLNLIVSPTGSLCAGGIATISALGATAYTWNTGVNGAQLVVSPVVNTTYSVIGANGNCVSSASTNVLVGASTLSLTTGPTPATVCPGGVLQLSATGANTYTWDNGSQSNAILVSPLGTTDYTVTGSNGMCTASAVIQVSPTPGYSITINASPGVTVCAGNSATLSALASQPGDFQWSGGTQATSVLVTPSVSSTYTVTQNFTLTGSRYETCAYSETITISPGTGTIPIAISPSSNSACAGLPLTFTATGASLYSWNSGHSGSVIAVTPASAGWIHVTGTSGGCQGMDSVHVGLYVPLPLAVAATPGTLICSGSTVSLLATGAYTAFSWTGHGSGALMVDTPGSDITYTVLASGDANGCDRTETVSVKTSALPLTTLFSKNMMCGDSTCNGSFTAQVSGGIPPYQFQIPGSTCSGSVCTNLCVGLHQLVTTDSLGCKSYNYFSIECDPASFTGFTDNGLASVQPYVYPNPARCVLNIDYEKNYNYSICTLTGQVLARGRSTGETLTIDLTPFAAGIYFATFESEGRITAVKFVVE